MRARAENSALGAKRRLSDECVSIARVSMAINASVKTL
jgi:hypothetical protein